MENKKIAVVFAGQARTFRYCYKTHLDFFKKEGYEFDFFIHTWSDQWYSDKIKPVKNIENAYQEDPEQLEKELIEIYKPKRWKKAEETDF